MATQDNPRIKVGLHAARPAPDNIPIGNIYVSTDTPIISVAIGPGTPHTWDEFTAGGIVTGTVDRIAKIIAPNTTGDSQSTDDGVNVAINAAGTAAMTGAAGATVTATAGNAIVDAPGAGGVAVVQSAVASVAVGVLGKNIDIVAMTGRIAAQAATAFIHVGAADKNIDLNASTGHISATTSVASPAGDITLSANAADVNTIAAGESLFTAAGSATLQSTGGTAAVEGLTATVQALTQNVTVTAGKDVILATPAANGIKLNNAYFLGAFAFLALPVAPPLGSFAYCTDLRVVTAAYPVVEGAGAGTGGLVNFSVLGWTIMGTVIPASA